MARKLPPQTSAALKTKSTQGGAAAPSAPSLSTVPKPDIRALPDPQFHGNCQLGTDCYYALLGAADEAKRQHNFAAVITYTKQAFQYFGALAESVGKPGESHDRQGHITLNSPFVAEHASLLVAIGDSAALAQLRAVLYAHKAFIPWRDFVDDHLSDLALVDHITAALGEHPGTLQSKLKGVIGHDDGRKLANLLHWLEVVGRVTRTKSGNSYELRLTPDWRPLAPVPAFDVTRCPVFGDRIVKGEQGSSRSNAAKSGCGVVLCALIVILAAGTHYLAN